MKFAIIGAGFSGLATAWHLLKKFSFDSGLSLCLFDEKGIGGGASGIAAGLLHPYAGAHAKLNWKGIEGFQATYTLLKIAEEALGHPVARFSGLLRVAMNEAQVQDYKKCAAREKEVIWHEDIQSAYHPAFPQKPGIWIPCGAVVHCHEYLNGLWKACQNQGKSVEFKRAFVENLQDLEEFDFTILAAGPGCRRFSCMQGTRMSLVKGQLLEIEWPKALPQLSFPINSSHYLTKHLEQNHYLAGATYERHFISETPDLEIAVQQILPGIVSLFPSLKRVKVLGCQAGLRVSTPSHLPLWGKWDHKTWYLTGMGSKGLLYHALYAEELVKTIKATMMT